MYLCQYFVSVTGKVLVRILYITRPRGITSTIAIAIGLRDVYNVVHKGDTKIVVQKKMKVFFCLF